MSEFDHPDFWAEYYRRNEIPWDLGGPTPVFQRLLDSGQMSPGRIIVLGAGRGHDARIFARHGFDVVAVDFAEEAVEAMLALSDEQAPVEVLLVDIFDLPTRLDGGFDYVLEYTCFCAIDPSRREEYADLVARLLKRHGTYIALAFPIVDRAGGPPFAVSPEELINLFRARGFKLQRREVPADSVRPRRGFEELLVLSR